MNSDSAHDPRDTVLYRWQGLIVSGHWFVAQGHSYPVRELQRVGWRAGPVPPARRRTLHAIAGSTALVGLVLAVALPPLLAVISGGTTILGAAVAVWLTLRRWPRPLLLCAIHRGLPVVLHASTDHLEFHKVYRALRRAAEWHADQMMRAEPGPAHPGARAAAA